MPDMDSMGTGGVPFPIGDPFDDGGYAPEERGKRMFLPGGPFGLAYPLGILPVGGYGYEEDEEDPNP